MRIAFALSLTVVLSACVAGGAVVQDASRSLARSAVNAAAQQYFPGVDVSPFTDCVIDNATTSEIVQLAQAASKGGGGAAEAVPVVRTIIARPEATQCLVGNVQGGALLTRGLL